MTGTCLVIRDGFSTTRFWSDVRAFGCTVVLLPGTTLSYLANLPPAAEDRSHPLRNVLAAPLPRNAPEIAERFGIRFRTMFNMTEVSCPIVSDWTVQPSASCGTIRPGAECRIVDDTDHEVPPGAVGELIVRCDQPWEMMAGYLNRPDATAGAWRNLWFHTGDAFRQDAAGNFFFVDRMKHTIRRGGENISSSELEDEVCLYAPVAECAAIGVPAEHGEEDVKVFVVPWRSLRSGRPARLSGRAGPPLHAAAIRRDDGFAAEDEHPPGQEGGASRSPGRRRNVGPPVTGQAPRAAMTMDTPFPPTDRMTRR